MKKNFIKILDNVNTGLLTLNKIFHAERDFTGAHFNAFILDKNRSKMKIGIDRMNQLIFLLQ